MSADVKDAIVLITSRTEKNRFGTGFVIHNDGVTASIVTCAHVVNDVGQDAALINGQPATAIKVDDGFDLAVLQMAAAGLPKALPLSATVRTGLAFRVAGFYRPDNKADQCQALDGVLEKADARRSAQYNTSVPAWWVKIQGNEYFLQPGHSGGPVVETGSGKVIGVIAIREGAGQKGIAISITALRHVWPEMPAGLLPAPAVLPEDRDAPLRINLNAEIEAFKAIVAEQDPSTRLICVCAPPESGKTHLLREYRRIAAAHQLKTLLFECKPQLNIDKCLNDIVSCYGIRQFPKYREFRKSGSPANFTRAAEEKWYQDLTWELFTDLGSYTNPPRLFVFFDTYEEADPVLKNWVTQALLPHLREYPLIVIIAGRNPIEPKPAWEEERLEFTLQGYKLDDYRAYCAAQQVQLPENVLQIVYTAVSGRPAGFIKLIRSQMAGGGL